MKKPKEMTNKELQHFCFFISGTTETGRLYLEELRKRNLKVKLNKEVLK